MRPDSKDAGYLLDMLEHARGVTTAVGGLTLGEYTADDTLRLAVERRIEIIGEAARRVSEPFKEAHPEIPWRKIVAQRNVLVHEYGEVEDGLVWQVATRSLPDLIGVLERLVPNPPRGEW